MREQRRGWRRDRQRCRRCLNCRAIRSDAIDAYRRLSPPMLDVICVTVYDADLRRARRAYAAFGELFA